MRPLQMVRFLIAVGIGVYMAEHRRSATPFLGIGYSTLPCWMWLSEFGPLSRAH
jgi:hypothetical protein